MGLEEELAEHEAHVDALLKSANKYLGALKAWKKACRIGHFGNLIKSSTQAQELVGVLPATTRETKSAWSFDIRDYLESENWRAELLGAAEKLNLKVLVDGEMLISSPVTVRTLPLRGMIQIGKANWPALRPHLVAAELKRLRDKNTGTNLQEFIESLYGAWHYLKRDDGTVKFRDIYDLFCLTPGYKKENSLAAFGQQIYALHRSEIRLTRGTRKIEIEYASSGSKDKELFIVISEDGRSIRYYGLYFK